MENLFHRLGNHKKGRQRINAAHHTTEYVRGRMMRTVIAAALVLICATAKTEDIYNWDEIAIIHDNGVEETSQLNRHMWEVLEAYECQLTAIGWKVVEWKPGIQQLGIQMLGDELRTTGVATSGVHPNGYLLSIDIISIPDGEDFDADWIAGKLLEQKGLRNPFR